MAEILNALFVPIDLEPILKLEMPKTKFINGVKDGAYYAGVLTSILNIGLDNEQAKEVMVALINNNMLDLSIKEADKNGNQ